MVWRDSKLVCQSVSQSVSQLLERRASSRSYISREAKRKRSKSVFSMILQVRRQDSQIEPRGETLQQSTLYEHNIPAFQWILGKWPWYSCRSRLWRSKTSVGDRRQSWRLLKRRNESTLFFHWIPNQTQTRVYVWLSGGNNLATSLISVWYIW